MGQHGRCTSSRDGTQQVPVVTREGAEEEEADVEAGRTD